MPDAETIAEFAPAKINLALHVTGRRSDGYHLLESLVAFTRIGDLVTVTPAVRDSFSVSGPFASAVPGDEDNLVLKARDSLRRAWPKQARPVRIQLTKNLPPAAGIGGGSSDAAATLRALAQLWRIPANALAETAAPLGADLPMCLVAEPLVARGIGERLERLSCFPSRFMVLVNPGIPVGTPEVFRGLSRRENPGLAPLPDKAFDIGFEQLVEWLRSTRNDLQAAAIGVAPAIADALAALDAAGAAFTRMSGSGATCFGLFRTAQEAEAAANTLRNRQPAWWIAPTESLSSPTLAKERAHVPA